MPPHRSPVLLLIAALALAAACQSSEREKNSPENSQDPAVIGFSTEPLRATPAPGAAATVNNPFLARAPADAPYFLATVNPMSLDDIPYDLAGLGAIYADLAEQMRAEATTPGEKFILAVMEEFSGDFDEAKIQALGFASETSFSLHGEGALPVVRFNLSDGAALGTLLDRLEAKSGVTSRRSRPGGIDTRVYVVEDGTIIVAISPTEVGLGFAPQAMTSWLTSRITDPKPVKNNLADSGQVEALAKGWTEPGTMVGAVDIVKLVAGMTAAGAPALRETFAALELPVLEGQCATEATALAAHAPRMTFQTSYNKKGMMMHSVLELSDAALLESLGSLASPVPGLGMKAPAGTLALLGLGVDVEAAAKLIHGRARQLVADPFECEALTDLNEAAADIAMTVDPANIPPFVLALRGLYVLVQDFDFSAAQHVEGLTIVKTQDPEALWSQLSGLVPPLKGVSLSSTPTKLPPIEDVPVDPVFVMRTSDLLAAGVGDRASASLPAFTRAKSSPNPPLLAFGYDVGAIFEKSLASIPDEEREPMNLMIENYKQFGLIIFELHVEPNGLAMDYHADFAAP